MDIGLISGRWACVRRTVKMVSFVGPSYIGSVCKLLNFNCSFVRWHDFGLFSGAITLLQYLFFIWVVFWIFVFWSWLAWARDCCHGRIRLVFKHNQANVGSNEQPAISLPYLLHFLPHGCVRCVLMHYHRAPRPIPFHFPYGSNLERNEKKTGTSDRKNGTK